MELFPNRKLSAKVLLGGCTLILISLVVFAHYLIAWKNSGLSSGSPPKPKNVLNTHSTRVAQAGTRPGAGGATPAIQETPKVFARSDLECMHALEAHDPETRLKAFQSLLDNRFTKEQLLAILDVFKAMRSQGKLREAEWDYLWRTLARRDPRMALSLLDNIKSDYHPAITAKLVAQIMGEWATKDPTAAINELNKMGHLSGKHTENAIISLVQGAARKDIDAATKIVLGSIKPNDPFYEKAMSALTEVALQNGGIEAAKMLFNQLPSDAHRKSAFKAVAEQMQRVSRLGEWLTENADKPYRNDVPYYEFIEGLSKGNPGNAMRFAAAIPPSPIDGSMVGVRISANNWIRQDMPGFSTFYSQLPPGQLKSTIDLEIASFRNGERRALPKQVADALFIMAGNSR